MARAIFHNGQRGTGPDPEPDPPVFGPQTLSEAASELAADIRANTEAERPTAPVKRGPGRPRKTR